MKRDEAIEIIQDGINEVEKVVWEVFPNEKEALDMAIRSLEAWESLHEKTAEWEAEALYEVEKHIHDEDKGEWRKWSHILTERTAFLCDVKKHLKEVENDKGRSD